MSVIIKNIVFTLSLLTFSTITIAKTQLLPIKCNNILLPVDPIIIDYNETQVRWIGNLHIESTLMENKNIILKLSYKDEKGYLVPFYSSEPLAINAGDEIGVGCLEGFSLTIKVVEIN